MTFNDRNLRPSARLLLALPIAALAFSLAACGAGETRPSEADVAKGLSEFFATQPGGEVFTDEASECLAGYLVDSELSDETLNYLADGEDRQKDQADKDLTEKIVAERGPECITG